MFTVTQNPVNAGVKNSQKSKITIIINKKRVPADPVDFVDRRVIIKENKKRGKYLYLAREVKKNYGT